MEDKNYYDILGVQTNASQEEIKRAYKLSKLAFSPDGSAMYSLLSQEECAEMQEKIEEAFCILYNLEKRAQYDAAHGINAETCIPKNQPMSLSEQLSNLSINKDNVAQPVITTAAEREEKEKSEEMKINRLIAQKKFALDYVVDEDFEKEIEQTTEFTGAFLKKIREYKNISIERLSEMTKVSKNYLISLEEEDKDKLPAYAYTRGFIYQYAKCLKLTPELVASSYIYRLKNLSEKK